MISDKIKNRLIARGKQWFASDNIAECIDFDEYDELIQEVTMKFEGVLQSLCIDTYHDPHSKGTPKRLAKMYINELMRGRFYHPDPVTAFPNEGENAYTGLIVVRAEITSLCAHHFQPIKGIAYIGIIPNHKVIGLSKYIRIAQHVASRGTLQEELTNMMSKAIRDAAGTENVGVYIAATHGCCENRGVRAHSSLTQTTVLHGKFLENSTIKEEFYKSIALQETYTGGR